MTVNPLLKVEVQGKTLALLLKAVVRWHSAYCRVLPAAYQRAWGAEG